MNINLALGEVDIIDEALEEYIRSLGDEQISLRLIAEDLSERINTLREPLLHQI